MLANWKRARKRAKSIRFVRNQAAKLGIATEHLSDEELERNVSILMEIHKAQTLTVNEAMQRLGQSFKTAAQSLRALHEASSTR